VLAFPIDEEPADSGRSPDSGGTGPGYTGEAEEAPALLGDIVICPAVAYRNAAARHSSYEDELALLVVHGILHLLGMDHEDDEEAEAMEAKERELLTRHHRSGQAAGDHGSRGGAGDQGTRGGGRGGAGDHGSRGGAGDQGTRGGGTG
jgi:probable rRNA maturation factor